MGTGRGHDGVFPRRRGPKNHKKGTPFFLGGITPPPPMSAFEDLCILCPCTLGSGRGILHGRCPNLEPKQKARPRLPTGGMRGRLTGGSK